MSEIQTCGHGLAAHATFHAAIAHVLDAVGRNLEFHLTALDPSDEVSRPEIDAYTSLAQQHRELVDRIRAVAEQMAGYRNLPLANHDMEVLTSEASTRVLTDLLRAEEQLLEMVRESTEQYRAMLGGEPGEPLP